MPDSSLPPSWGPAPFEERDLDAVLSGETADIPLTLRPVADTLAVLRGAAPTPAELRGEAAAMAEYRALGLGQRGRPAGPEQTLVLPARTDGRPPRRAARHRARRRGVLSVSRRSGALMGVAAAVLIVVVLAFGKLPGPIHGLTQSGHTSSASPSAARSSGGGSVLPGGVQGTGAAAKAPTASPTPTRDLLLPSSTPSSTPSSSVAPARLCLELSQAFYSYVEHSRPRSPWPAELSSLYQQVGKLAHSLEPAQISEYCRQYPGGTFHREDPGGGPRGAKSQDRAPANAAKASPSPAASSAPTAQSTAGSGNGSGGPGPGQGGQGGGPGQNP